MLARLGRWCFRHRWLTLITWVLAVFGAMVTAQVALGGESFNTQFDIPATESRQVVDLLQEAFPDRDPVTDAQIVFRAEQGVADPEVQAAMEELFAAVQTENPGVVVDGPYGEQGAFRVSPDGTIAYAELRLPDEGAGPGPGGGQLGTDIRDAAEAVTVPEGVQVEFGGDIFADFEMPESEIVGLLAAVIILVLAFGSILAMGLPIGTAMIGLMMGVALITIGSHLMLMPDFSLQIGAMIGLGVGIDYALFIVTRYREHLQAGDDPETSTAVALDTAGRAVLFAGVTVMISLLGMFLMGMTFVNGLAVAGSLTVGVMVLASLTLLPALLGFVRHRIDVTTRAALVALVVFAGLSLFGVVVLGTLALLPIGLVLAAGIMALSFVVPGGRTPMRRRPPKPREQQLWYRWSRLVQARPWTSFIGGLLTLVLLAIPVLSLRMGFSDNGNRAERQTVRKAYDLLAEGFGPGFNGPLTLVAEVGPDSPNPTADESELAAVTAAIAADPGVAFASPPMPISEDLVVWRVVSAAAPQAEATTELVHRLRDTVIPSTGVEVNVGGFTAVAVDLSDYFARRMVIFFGAVLSLSFLLLMVVFRSLLVPLKAVIMNLLSIGAAYGVVVAVFQWGWGAGVTNIGTGAPIEPFLPMMLFAIVFGLSMDYEVFLLSRIKEEYDRTGDNASAVADGLAATARVITAAALIMVCVFASFVAGDDRTVKMFGLGLAVAVAIDATIVRMVLVPATMELLGAKNWWIPRWLDRILPTIDVEGHDELHEGGVTEPAEPVLRTEDDDPAELVGSGRP
jgi:RND superfamily putative drug exporter